MLRRALFAACAASLAFASSASAVTTVIDGSPLNVHINDNGQVQIQYDAETPVGEFFPAGSEEAQAGLSLVTDASSEIDNALHGFLGFDFTPGLQGDVTGTGTSIDPFTQVTTFSAPTASGSTVDVEQTITYVNGEESVGVSYYMNDPSSSTSTDIVPYMSADLYVAGDDYSTGFLTGSPGSRTVGGLATGSGGTGGIREITPWAHFQEGQYNSAVHDQIRVMDNLDDTFDPAYLDSGVGVQWPSATVGYPFTGATFEAEWVFTRFDALTLSPSDGGERAEGATHQVTVSAENADGTPAVGKVARWDREGAHPGSGSVTLDSNGSGQISWQGTIPGVDDLTVYLDTNGNEMHDLQAEPGRTATVTWNAAITPETTHAQLPSGTPFHVKAFVLAQNGEADIGRDMRYWVQGANNQGSATGALHAGVVTASEGAVEFDVAGDNPGNDVISLFSDLNSDTVHDAGEPIAHVHLERFRLTLSPAQATRTAPGSHTVTATAQGPLGTSEVPEPIRWIVTGANPAAGSADPGGGGTTSIGWTGANTGRDTLSAYIDLDFDGQQDTNEPTAQATADWVAPTPEPPPPPPPPGPPPPAPLTIALDPTDATLDAGSRHEVDAFVRRAASPVAGVPVRFSVAGPNANAGTVDTSESGHALLSWNGQSNGTDTLTAYADENGDGTRQPSEPQATATVTWRNGLPPNIPTASSIDQLPDPTAFRQTNIEPVGGGEVLVKLPGGAANASQTVNKGFIPLREAAQLPVGTIINADQGRAKIEAAAKARGPQTSTADFYSGTFRVTQPRASNPVTEMVMEGGSFRSCTRSKSNRRGKTSQRRRTVRRLWGNGKGRFRTRGRYSSATVRGTEWVVEDRCDGTLTRVRSGTVTVRDFPRGRNVTVRAGRSHLALRNPPRNLRKP